MSKKPTQILALPTNVVHELGNDLSNGLGFEHAMVRAARELVPDWADKDDEYVKLKLMHTGLNYLGLKDVIDASRGYLRRDADRLARLEKALTLIAPDVRVAQDDHA